MPRRVRKHPRGVAGTRMRGADVGEPRQTRGQSLSGELERELGLVASALASSGVLSDQSFARMVDLHARFGRFADRGFGVERLNLVTRSQAGDFVRARGRDRRAPSTATMHLRRSAIRLLFRTARELGLVSGNPTLDLRLEPRSGVAGRPLTDDEVAICRTAALQSLTSTRLSAAWALSEATARTAELPHLLIADLDLDHARVWLHGSPRTDPRWGTVDEWGVRQLARHVRNLGDDPDPRIQLTYSGSGSAESRQAASCLAIGETLRRAGLGDEPDVRPLSVAAWAGARVFAETGRIEMAASALGVRSLDRAARLIGFDWHDADGPA